MADYKKGEYFYNLAQKCLREENYNDYPLHMAEAAGYGHLIAIQNIYYGFFGWQDYSKNLRKYEERIGNMFCAHILGYMYLCGLGVAKDLNMALEFLLMAAKNGNYYSHYTLGLLNGAQSDIQSKVIAMEHYLVAIKQGFLPAVFEGAILFENNNLKDTDSLSGSMTYGEA